MPVDQSRTMGSILLSMLLLISGCSSGGAIDGNGSSNIPDTTAPQVSSTAPAQGTVGIATNAAVTITFTEPMDPATLTPTSITLTGPSGTVTGAVTASGATATFTPSVVLASNSVYTVTVTTAVSDVASNPLAANYVFTFTTGAGLDTTAPTVLLTVPASNAVGIATNTAVTITFTEPMDPATLTPTSITLTGPSGTVTGAVTASGATATFTPSVVLASNSVYTVTVTTAVSDVAGNPLAANYVFTFTTGGAVETNPPTVLSTAPTNHATGVPVGTTVNITFSESMDPATLTTTSILLSGPTGSVSGTVIYSGATATFTPSSSLVVNSMYTMTVTTAVRDLAGNQLVSNYVFSFTTGVSVAGQNMPIANVLGSEQDPQIISDGSGGSIIVWWTGDNGGTHDIYAQRVNSAGVPQWAVNGVPISTAVGDQVLPQLTSDGAGGAIIAWQDFRGDTVFGDVFAQRVNGAGVVQWAANGIPVATATLYQRNPGLVSDGEGGAIIAWEDSRNGAPYMDIYAQRVSGAGIMQWAADGVPISTTRGTSDKPQIVSDGTGGAIIVWQDNSVGLTYEIYAQRINGAGTVQWASNGVLVTDFPFERFSGRLSNSGMAPQVISDGANGAIIAWEGDATATSHIYAQRLSSDGGAQWIANGVRISASAFRQSNPRLTADGANGAIIVWQDMRSNSNYDIYAQHVTGAGIVQWATDGVAISTAIGSQEAPQLIADGAGGAVIIWQDKRNITDFDIYAQRINSVGVVQWVLNGVSVSTAVYDQIVPQLVLHGSGRAMLVWQDKRNQIGCTSGNPFCEFNWDIYGQIVNGSGLLE